MEEDRAKGAAPWRPRWDVVVLPLALALITAAGFGWYAGHGWLAVDDWTFLAAARGTASPIGGISDPARPLLGPYLSLLFHVFDDHSTALLIFSATLTWALATLLFGVARLAGAPRVPAVALAVLTIVTPWSDANTLWVTGSQAHAALVLLLAGALVALLGLRRGWPLGWHLIASLLYAASALLYELGALLPLASIGLYWLVAPGRRATRRWAMDVVAVVAAVLYGQLHANKDHGSLRQTVDHGVDVAHGAATVLQRALDPTGRLVPLGLLVVLAAVATVVASWWRPRLRPAAAMAGGGLVVAVLSWLIFVPALSYLPTDPNVGNRVNGAAVIGIAMVVVGVAMGLAVTLTRYRLGTALGALLVLGVVVHYAVDLRGDERRWAQAATLRHQVVDTVLRQAATGLRAPDPPTIVVRGVPAVIGPNLWVAGEFDDLAQMLQMESGNPRVRALMDTPELTWRCEPDRAVAQGPLQSQGPGGRYEVPYGGLAVDVSGNASWVIDLASCRARLAGGHS